MFIVVSRDEKQSHRILSLLLSISKYLFHGFEKGYRDRYRARNVVTIDKSRKNSVYRGPL